MSSDRSQSTRGVARGSGAAPAGLRAPGTQILGSHRARAAALPPLPRGRVGATPAPPQGRHGAAAARDAEPIQRAFDRLSLGDAPVIGSPSASPSASPLSAGWGDLGQSSSSAARYLICELTSPIAVGSEPCYRLGPPNAERSSADRLYSYQWTVRRRADGRQIWQTVTASPEIRILAAAPGPHRVEVVVLSDGTPTDVCLSLEQDVEPEPASLTAELHGASADVARAVRELVTELRGYIRNAAAATGPRGITVRLLASVLYIEILSRSKPARESELDHAAVLLEAGERSEHGDQIEHALFATRSPDRPLGVGQIRPMTAAMVLGATPWIDQDRNDRRAGRDQIKANYDALPLETKRAIFTQLRWPKSNIAMAARLLGTLKNRANRYPELTAAQLAADPRAVALLATEYISGGTRTPVTEARPSGYGSWVWQQMQESLMARFFPDD